MDGKTIFLHLGSLNLDVLEEAIRSLDSWFRETDSVVGVLFPLPAAQETSILGIERLSPRRRAFRSYQEDRLARAYGKRGISLVREFTRGDLDRLLEFVPRLIVYQPLGGWEEQLFDQKIDRWAADKGISIIRAPRNTLLDPDELPFHPKAMAKTFTPFRQAIETIPWQGYRFSSLLLTPPEPEDSPIIPPELEGLEAPSGRARLDHWFSTTAPSNYKETRNQGGPGDSSSKLSFWLADGSLQAKMVGRKVLDYEKGQGANESTYWILFELLWRDFFAYLGRAVGPRMYHPSGFRNRRSPGLVDSYSWTYRSIPPEPRYREAFTRWTLGETGQELVDCAMKELACRGTMCNRQRQWVASFLIHDLNLPWWWGAAWFEYHLLDYDPDSNWGNWAYLAGVGADPRPIRRFDIEKQGRTYDPEGRYRKWVQGQNWQVQELRFFD